MTNPSVSANAGHDVDQPLPAEVSVQAANWLTRARNYPIFSHTWLRYRSMPYLVLSIVVSTLLAGVALAQHTNWRIAYILFIVTNINVIGYCTLGPSLAMLVRRRGLPQRKEAAALIAAIVLGLVGTYFAEQGIDGALKLFLLGDANAKLELKANAEVPVAPDTPVAPEAPEVPEPPAALPPPRAAQPAPTPESLPYKMGRNFGRIAKHSWGGKAKTESPTDEASATDQQLAPPEPPAAQARSADEDAAHEMGKMVGNASGQTANHATIDKEEIEEAKREAVEKKEEAIAAAHEAAVTAHEAAVSAREAEVAAREAAAKAGEQAQKEHADIEISTKDLIGDIVSWTLTSMVAAWVGGGFDLLHFFRQRRRLQEALQRRELESARVARNEAELKLSVLAAQVEPHFLFNTLAGVRSAIQSDPQRATAIVDHLVEYLRATIPQLRNDGSSNQARLGQQMEAARAYLALMNARIPRLSYAVEIGDGMSEVSVPPLMLISLVENAVKHGVEPKIGPALITVAARQTTVDGVAMATLSVSDDGVGFGGTTSGTGIGLTNIRERLATLYGSRATLTLKSRSEGGVCAEIQLPLAA